MRVQAVTTPTMPATLTVGIGQDGHNLRELPRGIAWS
jgi:hypothetical protein